MLVEPYKQASKDLVNKQILYLENYQGYHLNYTKKMKIDYLTRVI